MSEYVKEADSNAWKVISYRGRERKPGSKADGAPVTADGMEQEGDASDGEEAPDPNDL